MDIDSEHLLVIILISSRRVSATVAWLHPVQGERVVSHKTIDCHWHSLSDRGKRQTVADAVQLACDSAGVEAYSAYIAMSDPSIGSQIASGWADLGEEMQLTLAEREQALVRARHHALGEDRELLHALPIHWTVRSRKGEREVTDPVGERGSRLTGDVLLVTARKGYREELAHLLDSCTLQLDGVIAPPVALHHGIGGKLRTRGSAVVFDCGARHTSLLVHRRGRLLHLQTWDFGGDELTRRIAEELRIPPDQAEALKHEVDLGAHLAGGDHAGQQYLWREVQERHRLLAPAARACAASVRAFFAARARELRDRELIGQVGQVHLVGRASALGGLPLLLKEVFGLPVVLGTGARDRDPSAELLDLLISGVVRCAADERRIALGRTAFGGRIGRLFGWLGRPLE